jgi:hypothetical protein
MVRAQKPIHYHAHAFSVAHLQPLIAQMGTFLPSIVNCVTHSLYILSNYVQFVTTRSLWALLNKSATKFDLLLH